MKAERTCGGSVIEPRGHSLTLHQHSAPLKLHPASHCCWGGGRDKGTVLFVGQDQSLYGVVLHFRGRELPDYIMR